VAGSFISKLTFLSLFFLLKFEKKIINIFFLIFLIVLTFLTNERMASIILLFSSIFYFIFCDKKIIKNITICFLICFTLIFLIFNNQYLKKRYVDTTLSQLGIYESWHNNVGSFKGSQYYGHFSNAVEIFKKNILFGSGLNTFRVVCGKEKYSTKELKKIKNSCSTHPHNFYFEILSDTGLFGFFLFLYFLIKIFKNIFYIQNYNQRIISLTIFLLLFWPIKTTGSIFSSWNGFLYLINISYILYLSRYSGFLKKKLNN